MKRQIFRQAALDRLASPENLDRPVRLIGLRAWSAFAVLGLVLAAVVVWAFFATASVRVEARGIAMPRGGLMEIVAQSHGQVGELPLAVGQRVSEGTSVVTLMRPDIERALTAARGELAAAEARNIALADFYRQSDQRQTEFEDARLETIDETRSLVQRRKTLLEERIASLGSLLERQIVARDRIIDAELELAQTRERLSRLDDDGSLIQAQRRERRSEHRLALIDEQEEVDRLSRDVARLETQLSSESVIHSPHTGIVLEVLVAPGDVIATGDVVSVITPDRSGEDVVGLVFVPPDAGKKVAVGTQVEVEPSTAQRERFGYVRGEVVQVSQVPASDARLRSLLKNARLSDSFSIDGAPFEVEVRFEKDPSTPSGLAWSSSNGPNEPIQAGTLLHARLIVDRVPVVGLVLPSFAGDR